MKKINNFLKYGGTAKTEEDKKMEEQKKDKFKGSINQKQIVKTIVQNIIDKLELQMGKTVDELMESVIIGKSKRKDLRNTMSWNTNAIITLNYESAMFQKCKPDIKAFIVRIKEMGVLQDEN